VKTLGLASNTPSEGAAAAAAVEAALAPDVAQEPDGAPLHGVRALDGVLDAGAAEAVRSAAAGLASLARVARGAAADAACRGALAPTLARGELRLANDAAGQSQSDRFRSLPSCPSDPEGQGGCFGWKGLREVARPFPMPLIEDSSASAATTVKCLPPLKACHDARRRPASVATLA